MIFFNLAEVSHDVIIKNNRYKEYRKYRLLENNTGNILGVCTEQEEIIMMYHNSGSTDFAP